MAQMAFGIIGIGHCGLSVGGIKLAFRYNGHLLMYESAHMLSGSGGTGTCITNGPFTIPDDPLLFDFSGQVVRFKLEGSQLWGPMEMKFEIFFRNRNDAVYNVTRRPDINGGIVGGVEYVNTFRKLPVDQIPSMSWARRWFTAGGINRENAAEALRNR